MACEAPGAAAVRATRYPFVYDAGGFKVEFGKGSRARTHSRMACEELYGLVNSAASPLGNTELDGAFYAAQLVHYGLPRDFNPQRAIDLLHSSFKIKSGACKISVPDTIRTLEKQLKAEYCQLVIEARAAAAAEAVAEQRRALQKHKEEERAMEAELARLENESSKHKKRKYRSDQENTPTRPSYRAPEKVEEAEDAEEDAQDQHDKSPRRQTRRVTAVSTSGTAREVDPPVKRTRIDPPKRPPAPGDTFAGSERVRDTVTPAVCSRKHVKTDVRVTGQASTTRLDSNPPAAHSAEEHARRNLLRLTTGEWSVSTKVGGQWTPDPDFILRLGKVFQKERAQQPQNSSAYIKSHSGYFKKGDFEGFLCSSGQAELDGGRLKLVLSWAAIAKPLYQDALGDKRRFELFFDESEMDGYLYGHPDYDDGFAFRAKLAQPLSKTSYAFRWNWCFFACKAAHLNHKYDFNLEILRSKVAKWTS